MNAANLSRRRAIGLMLGSTALLLARPAFSAGVRVINYGNHPYRLPEQVKRVATTWEAQNSILAMLGYGDRIVATTKLVHDMPVFQKFVPNISKAIIAGSTGGEINTEALMAVRPDILFIAGKIPPERQRQLEEAGIAVVSFQPNSLAAIVERTLVTGQMLGPDAYHRAQEYKEYFDGNVKKVKDALAGIPQNHRLRVYHAMGEPLRTTGRPSLNQDWMDLGGVINVAEHWGQAHQYSVTVSMEQVLAADPDVIISMRAPVAQMMQKDPAWKNLRAVREGRIYANPRGMFWWCRETSEEALQFLWVAKTLYPDALPHVDMRQETRDFYHRFYGYKLSEAEITAFLHPTT